MLDARDVCVKLPCCIKITNVLCFVKVDEGGAGVEVCHTSLLVCYTSFASSDDWDILEDSCDLQREKKPYFQIEFYMHQY